MKRKDTFLVHTENGETVLVPVGGAAFSGIVRGNALFGDILGLLAEETTEDALLDALCGRWDAPREVLAADLSKALAGLRAVGALDE